jgi:SH3-like domain-containing protein
MVRVPRAEVRQSAAETAEILFYAEQDVVLELIQMEGNYARVRHADGATGYVRVTQVWGL